jgi:23S rRNA (pseudouridine1915-N3)-methyltransferase
VRVLVLAVGRSRDAEIAALVARWAGRCPWPVELKEIATSRAQDPSRRRAEEARRLLAAATGDAAVVALDPTGADLTSEGFARQLGTWRDTGRRLALFLIGGPDGHGAVVLERADLVLALGRMTWPHELVRAMLAEQLYRAATILAGHPYHRG